MEKLNATVVIWGNDNYNVLGLLRELVPYVEEVITLIHKKETGEATKSIYCGQYIIVQSYEDGIEQLKKIGNTLIRDGFVITTNDVLAEYVDQNYDELSKYYHLTGTTKQGLLTKIQSKVEMCKLAKDIGMTEPNTFMLDANTNLDEIECPILIKPDQKSKVKVGHNRFHTFSNKEELKIFQKSLGEGVSYNAQMYVEREEEYLMYGCRMANGDLVIPGAIIKDRWHHGRVVRRIPPTVDISLMLKFLERIGFYGLFSFEYGLMKGKAYFFEVNLRNDGTSLYYYLSGANMPLLWISSFFNKQDEVSRKVTKENVFIDGIGDFSKVLDGSICFKKWRDDVKNATIYRYYDKSDKKPFLYAAMHTFPYQLLLLLAGRYRKRKK